MGISLNQSIPITDLVSCLDSANPQSYSGNVVPNPLDLFAWCGTAGLNTCSISRDDSINRSPAGGIPLKMFSQGTDSYIATYSNSIWNLAQAASAQSWTLSFWAKASSTATALPYLFSANSSGAYLEALSNTFTVTTFWQRFSFSVTFTNASTFYVQARLGCTTNGVNIWFDGLQVERSSVVTTFNPLANTNGNRWVDLINRSVPVTVNEKVEPYLTYGLLQFGSTGSGTSTGSFPATSQIATLGTGNWSISIWWRSSTTTQNNYSCILSQGYPILPPPPGQPAVGAWALRISTNSSNLSFSYYESVLGSTVETTASSGINVNDNLWHHIGVVRNGTSLIVYRDAQNVLSTTLPSNFNFGQGSSVSIGSELSNFSFANGFISNISVYRTNLSADQVQQLYDSYIPRYYSHIGGILYTTPGTYTFTVPEGIYALTILCVGGGGASATDSGSGNAGGTSSFGGSICIANGGGGGTQSSAGAGGTISGSSGDIGGGNGGGGGYNGSGNGGGGGAGGYAGNGGAGSASGSGNSGSGGGGGGGGSWSGTTPSGSSGDGGAGGGGIGVYGQGANGAGGGALFSNSGGQGGSGGDSGTTGTAGTFPWNGSNGGKFGGGGGANQFSSSGGGGGGGTRFINNYPVFPRQTYTVVVGAGGSAPSGGAGGNGAVRVIWGLNRRFPSTNVGQIGREQEI